MILAFDLATSSGFAAGDQRGVAGFGSFELRRTSDRVAPYLAEAKAEIISLVDRFKPALIGFEAPILMFGRDNPLKVRKLHGLAIKAEEVAYERGIPCREASLGQIRTHFLGKGYPRDSKSVKLKTRVRCRDLGWDVSNGDEADALALLSYLLALENPDKAIATTPLFQSKASRARGRKLANAG